MSDVDSSDPIGIDLSQRRLQLTSRGCTARPPDQSSILSYRNSAPAPSPSSLPGPSARDRVRSCEESTDSEDTRRLSRKLCQRLGANAAAGDPASAAVRARTNGITSAAAAPAPSLRPVLRYSHRTRWTRLIAKSVVCTVASRPIAHSGDGESAPHCGRPAVSATGMQ